MKVYYCDQFVLPLPVGHRFPLAKYHLLRERIAQSNRGQYQLLVPKAASDAEILLAHGAGYLNKVMTGSMSARELRELGFPWFARADGALAIAALRRRRIWRSSGRETVLLCVKGGHRFRECPAADQPGGDTGSKPFTRNRPGSS